MYHRTNKLDYEKLYKEIDACSCVSFDLFDTILKRECSSPKRLFQYVEKKIEEVGYEVEHFSDHRINAENKVRNESNFQEITLDEIYAELKNEKPNVDWDEIKNIEIEHEYCFSTLNPFMAPVLDYCEKKQKRLIIISDIYLLRNVIEHILEINQVKYSELFISSELKLTKYTGDLFKHVLSHLNLDKRQLVHIGDNKRSDYIMPRLLGIRSIHIPTEMLKLNNLNNYLYKKSASYRDLCSFISNHTNLYNEELKEISLEDFFYKSGFEIQGPILYGFSKWLYETATKDKVDKLYFLARDGQIMEAAFDYMFEQSIIHKYIYVSRRSLIVPTLWLYPEIEDIYNTMFWPRLGDIATFIKKIGLNIDDFKDILKKYNFDIYKECEYTHLFRDKKFQELYSKYIKAKMIDNSRAEFDNLLLYLKQINMTGNVGIVDIGWNGNMQLALSKVLKIAGINVTLYGYYIGVNPFADNVLKNKICAKGYLFGPNKNEMLYQFEKSFTSLFELMFIANHGSVEKFIMDQSKVVPVLYNWEFSDHNKDEYTYISRFQEGAIEFIKIIKEHSLLNYDWQPDIVTGNLISLGCYPKLKTASKFGDLFVLDDKLMPMAKPQAWKNYLKSAKALLRDFVYTPWKVGFLVRLFKLSLPYYDLLCLARKIYFKFRNSEGK